jgi:hypothetical protein
MRPRNHGLAKGIFLLFYMLQIELSLIVESLGKKSDGKELEKRM